MFFCFFKLLKLFYLLISMSHVFINMCFCKLLKLFYLLISMSDVFINLKLLSLHEVSSFKFLVAFALEANHIS